jgi:hypothetical protein
MKHSHPGQARRRGGTLLTAALLAAHAASAQSLSPTQGLSFGAFVAASNGTLTVQPSGARSTTGQVYAIQQGPPATAAVFTVQGTPQASYNVSLPAPMSVTLNDGSGHAMAVAQFTRSNIGLQVIGPGGQSQFSVGAQLQIPSAMPRGNYSAAFNVTVNYE